MAKQKFYAVANGRLRGVFNTWDECADSVTGFSKAVYKSFKTEREARDYCESYRSFGEVPRASESPAPGPGNGGSGYSDYGGISGRSPGGYSASAGARVGASSLPLQKIYTDGSALGNQHKNPRGGYGVYWGPGDVRNAAVPLSAVERTNVPHTNARAELHGIGHALLEIESEYENGTPCRYEVISDSKYAQNAIDTWAKEWRKSNWKTSSGSAVCHQDIIEDASERLEKLRENNVPVELKYVKGHDTCEGNINADRLARQGAEQDQPTG